MPEELCKEIWQPHQSPKVTLTFYGNVISIKFCAHVITL